MCCVVCVSVDQCVLREGCKCGPVRVVCVVSVDQCVWCVLVWTSACDVC